MISINNSDMNFSEIMIKALLLKLNANDMFPATRDCKYTHRIYFEDEIIKYTATIRDDGLSYMTFTEFNGIYNQSRTVDIQPSSCLFDPLFDPNIILDKIVDVALFVHSLSDHMASADMNWISHGAESIINGSKSITVKHNDVWNPRIRFDDFSFISMGIDPRKPRLVQKKN